MVRLLAQEVNKVMPRTSPPRYSPPKPAGAGNRTPPPKVHGSPNNYNGISTSVPPPMNPCVPHPVSQPPVEQPAPAKWSPPASKPPKPRRARSVSPRNLFCQNSTVGAGATYKSALIPKQPLIATPIIDAPPVQMIQPQHTSAHVKSVSSTELDHSRAHNKPSITATQTLRSTEEHKRYSTIPAVPKIASSHTNTSPHDNKGSTETLTKVNKQGSTQISPRSSVQAADIKKTSPRHDTSTSVPNQKATPQKDVTVASQHKKKEEKKSPYSSFKVTKDKEALEAVSKKKDHEAVETNNQQESQTEPQTQPPAQKSNSAPAILAPVFSVTVLTPASKPKTVSQTSPHSQQASPRTQQVSKNHLMPCKQEKPHGSTKPSNNAQPRTRNKQKFNGNKTKIQDVDVSPCKEEHGTPAHGHIRAILLMAVVLVGLVMSFTEQGQTPSQTLEQPRLSNKYAFVRDPGPDEMLAACCLLVVSVVLVLSLIVQFIGLCRACFCNK